MEGAQLAVPLLVFGGFGKRLDFFELPTVAGCIAVTDHRNIAVTLEEAGIAAAAAWARARRGAL